MTKKKDPKDLLKMGRPPKYSEELAIRICREVATTTNGLKKICKLNPDFPTEKTINEWRLDYPDFSLQYDTAKRVQADLLAQEIQDIADDDSHDILFTDQGERQNTEFIARSRLRVDTRKWIACKLLPKIYGEKTTNETTVTIKHEDRLKELE